MKVSNSLGTTAGSRGGEKRVTWVSHGGGEGKGMARHVRGMQAESDAERSIVAETRFVTLLGWEEKRGERKRYGEVE